MTAFHELNRWPSFNGHSVNSFERGDGMRHAVIGSDSVSPADINALRTTRIVYRIVEEGALFLGLMVRGKLRGAGTGVRLVEYFMNTVGEVEGQFAGTGVMRKPLVTLAVARVGLKPVQDAFLAEILPVPKSSTTEIPQINIVRNTLPPEDLIDGSPTGKFYEVVPPAEVVRCYPLTTPDKVVALHTYYE